MSKSTSKSRRQRNTHTHDEQPDKTSFFSKASEKKNADQKNTSSFFQTKLATGQANGPYEQRADHASQAVADGKNAKPVLHQTISSVQLLATPVEDEKLGTNDARMAKDKEIQEKSIQRSEANAEKDKLKSVQKMSEAEEEKSPQLQKKDDPVQEELSETVTKDALTNTAQSCNNWEGDPQSFSIRAAQNFCKDAFNISVFSPDTVICSSSSCVVNYTNGGFNIKIAVDLSGLPGIVAVSGTAAPFILRPQRCSYHYSCDDTGSISFTRINCQLI